jgi:hypothetical protein
MAATLWQPRIRPLEQYITNMKYERQAYTSKSSNTHYIIIN